MATETIPEVLETTGTFYRGFNLPSLAVQRTLRSNVGVTKKVYQKSQESVTATVWLGFYTVGEDLDHYESKGEALPDELSNLPEDVKAFGRRVFDDCQRRSQGKDDWAGVYFKDVLDFDAKPKVGTVIPEGYAFAELIKDVDWEVDEKRGLYVPHGSRIPVDVPISNGAFAVPHGASIYNSWSGLPGKVEPNSEKAVKMLVDSGYTEQQARNKLSKVFTAVSGLAVVRSSASPYNGPLCLCLISEPWDRGDNVGSVAASRLASGASPDSEDVVSRSKYVSVVRERDEALARIKTAQGHLPKLRAALDDIANLDAE